MLFLVKLSIIACQSITIQIHVFKKILKSMQEENRKWKINFIWIKALKISNYCIIFLEELNNF
jgi:hypothetical protein